MNDLALIEKEEKEVLEVANSFLKNSSTDKQLTALEKEQFLQLCKAFKLNPFKREIYAIVYGTGNFRNCSIVIGYEVFLKRAYQSRFLDGWKVWVEGEINKEDVTKSTMKGCIEISRKDWSKPFYHEVLFSEYVGLKYNSETRKKEVNAMWLSKPVTMIKKVVIGQGFRLCFPEQLEGIPYFEEELHEQGVYDSPKKKVLTEGIPLEVPAEIQKEIEAKNNVPVDDLGICTLSNARELKGLVEVVSPINETIKNAAKKELTEEEKAAAIKEEIEQAEKSE